MALIVRKDLALPKGKLGVQLAHGAVSLSMKTKDSELFRQWFAQGQKKVALYIEDEKALLSLNATLNAHTIPTSLVRDAGRTVLEPGTLTVLAAGPAQQDVLEKLTAHLKLV